MGETEVRMKQGQRPWYQEPTLEARPGPGWYLPIFDPEREGPVAVGIDVIEIPRIQRSLDDFGERFLRRVYTERERHIYRGRVSELAARFAAKEATSKALGTGIRGIRWREMEVLPNRRGKPVLILHGGAAERARVLGLTHFSVSLTHSRSDAMAFVVASGPGSAPVDTDADDGQVMEDTEDSA
jgi:holo-[acyl-carrier protein] synthase